MTSSPSSSGTRRPDRASWGRRLVADLRQLSGRWRRPTALTPAFPVLPLTMAALLTALAVRLAFEIDAASIQTTRDWPPGVVGFFRGITNVGTSGWIWVSCLVIAAAAMLARGQGQGRGDAREHGHGHGLKADAGLLALAQRAVYVVASLAVSGIMAQVLKQIVGRGRPKFLDEGGPFIFDSFSGRSSFSSFPSGHSTTAFALGVALSFFLPRWRIPLLLAASTIAFSRIAIGAHYPSDTIAGAFLGAVSAYVVARGFARRDIAFSFRGGRLTPRAPGAVGRALRGLLEKRP